MRAWACELRRSLPYAMRGSTRSSAYRVSPVTLPHASIFGSGCPTMVKRSLDMVRAPGLRHARTSASGLAVAGLPEGGQLHRVEDLRVAGAAAQVPGEGFADLVARRRRVLGQQRLG